MASEHPTVEDILQEMEHKDVEPNYDVCMRLMASRIRDAYKRETAALAARIGALTEDLETCERGSAELHACLQQAYGDKTGTYQMRGTEVERWRKALYHSNGGDSK